MKTICNGGLTQCPKRVQQNHARNLLILLASPCANTLTENVNFAGHYPNREKLHASRTYSCPREVEPVVALSSGIHHKAVFREALTEVGGGLPFIVDDQDPHRVLLGPDKRTCPASGSAMVESPEDASGVPHGSKGNTDTGAKVGEPLVVRRQLRVR
jgi:hypothetical protein